MMHNKGFAVFIMLAAAFAAGCQGNFGTYRLADGFEISATGKYSYTPMPSDEAGVHYKFIGVGWLAHDERGHTWHLLHKGRELAAAPYKGSMGWRLNSAGRKRVKEAGWSVSGEGAAERPFIVGSGTLKEPGAPGSAREQPGQRAEGDYTPLRHWTIILRPRLKLGKSCDRVIFVCDARHELYMRVAAFDSSRYQFVDTDISFDPDNRGSGASIRFSLRDKKTKKLLRGKYPYTWWRPVQEVILAEPKAATQPASTREAPLRPRTLPISSHGQRP